MIGVDVEFYGPLRWNVAFEESRTAWGHVLAFASVGDRWLIVDPHIGYTETYLLKSADFDHWILGLSAMATILRIDGARSAWPWSGLFCVGKVKHLIGLRSGAFTPRGLMRDLLRAGAQKVYARESQNPEGRPGAQVGA